MNLTHILALGLLVCLCSQAPVQFSWDNFEGVSYLTQVKNQNFPAPCNSGWAIATTDMLNSRIKRLRKAQAPDVALSSQVLLSCDHYDYGCMGGQPTTAIRWIKFNNITDESCHAYKAKGYTNGEICNSAAKCQVCQGGSCKSAENSKVYALSDYGPVTGEDQMVAEIQRYGPIVCGINTDELSKYTSGVLDSDVPAPRINHYVLVYGWGHQKDTPFWMVKNSWGPAWGEKGHFRILRGSNVLGIESKCYYSSLVDTWTNDHRNKTLPATHPIAAKLAPHIKTAPHLKTAPLFKTEPHLKTEPEATLISSFTYDLPNYLTTSKSSLTPNSCNTAWAFSVIQMIADRYSMQSGRKSPIFLSVQALLNCGAGGCQNGSPADALLFAQKYGLPQEGCQTYTGVQPAKQSCSAVNNCAYCNGTVFSSKCFEFKSYKRWKIFDYGSFSGMAEMKNKLSEGPIVCGMHSSKLFQDYKGGIFSEISVVPKLDHYVQVVGWGSESGKNYWVGRNSWGTAWGESSFFRIQMGGNNLGIQNKCYFSKGFS